MEKSTLTLTQVMFNDRLSNGSNLNVTQHLAFFGMAYYIKQIAI